MKAFQLVCFLLLLIIYNAYCQSLSSPVMRIIAGQGVCDNQLATTASLYGHSFTAMNSLGDLVIADRNHNRIRKVYNNGTIITIAGTGISGYNGDGIIATTAQIASPNGVAVDSNDLVYFSDSGNNRIRAILSNGTIVTIAGTGVNGFSGDGADAKLAKIYLPFGMAISPINNNLIFADVNNNRIRMVSYSTGIISTIAGTATQGYNNDNIQATSASLFLPYACAFAPNGNVIISDSNNYRIRMVNSNTGIITTIAGTGSSGYNGDGILATTAKLNSPYGVVVDSNNQIYIADSYNHRIRKILSNGTIITFAGTGSIGFNGDYQDASSANINTPQGITFGLNGDAFISDTGNMMVRRILSNGTITPFAGFGSGTYCPAIMAVNSLLGGPRGIHIDSNGNTYIAEISNYRVSRITKNGMISSIAGTGKSGNSGDYLLATESKLSNPNGVTTDLDGQVIISDSSNNVIRKILNNGTMVIIAGTGTSGFNGDYQDARSAKLSNPLGIAFNYKTNELYIADSNNYRIRKILSNGTIVTIAGTGVSGYNGDGIDATSATIRSTYGIALNSKSEIYFTDVGNSRVRKIFTNGTITTVAGIGTNGFNGDYIDASLAKLSSPNGIAIDTNDEVLIADTSNYRIRKILNNGTIITIAGTGVSGNNGDNMDPTSTKLNSPYFVAVRPTTGEVLISDTGNNYLRMISTSRQCNGTLATDSMVCSGNGVCFSTDVCACNPGYSGTICEITTCNGFETNDPRGCNNHGVCLGPNICNCTSGFNGTFCEISLNLEVTTLTSCFGVLFNESLVCSGNGQCSSIDNCTCNSGWFGSNCSITQCFGVYSNSTDSSICNGHGKCSNFDNCTCDNYWTGLNCSEFYNNSAIDPVSNTSSINNSTDTTNNSTLVLNNSTSFNSTDNSTLSTNSSMLNSTIDTNSSIITNSTVTNDTVIANITITNSTTITNNTTITNSTVTNSTIITNNTTNNNGTSTNTNTNNGTVTIDQLKCFGIPVSDPTVCGGHGTCLSPDKCECKSNTNEGYWAGSNCTSCSSSYSGGDCKTALICDNCNNYYAFFAFMVIPVVVIASIPPIWLVVRALLSVRKGGNTPASTNSAAMNNC